MIARDIVLNNFWWKLLSLLLAALTWLTIATALHHEEILKQTPVVSSFTRTFPALPVTLLTSPNNLSRFHINPGSTSVYISGPAERLQKLQERDIHVYIDLSDVGDEKQLRRNIQALVPRDLKVDKIDPAFTSVDRVSTVK